MDKNNNFISKSAGLYNLLGITEWAAFKIMALGTAIMFGGMGHNYAMNNLPEWNMVIVFTAVLLGYFSVDWGLSSLIKYYYDNRKDKVEDEQEQKVRATLFRWILMLIIFRFIASWSMSLLSNTAVVDIATGDLNAEYFINSATRQDSIRSHEILSLKDDYTELVANEADRLNEAKKEGHNIVTTAINLGDYWQKLSYKKNKFSWLESPENKDKKDKTFAANVRKALADSTELVQHVYTKTIMAETRYNNASNDTTTLSVAAKILALGELKAKERSDKMSTRYSFLTIAVSVFGVLGWIGVYIRSLLRRAGVDYQRERTFSHVVNGILSSWAEWILIKMELIFKIDIDGNGTIGTTKSASTPSGGFFKRMKSYLSPSGAHSTTPTTGASAVTSHSSSPAGTTGDSVVKNYGPTTPEDNTTYKPPVVVKGFSNTPPEDVTTTTTVVPPTPVPTGVSPVVPANKTTTTHEVVVKVVHGIGYVIHNGQKRDKAWVRKTLNSYLVRRKNYISKKSDTTTVDANIELMNRYIHQIDEMEKEAT